MFSQKWFCILIELVVVPSRGAGSMEAIRIHVLSRSLRAGGDGGGGGGGGGVAGEAGSREKFDAFHSPSST